MYGSTGGKKSLFSPVGLGDTFELVLFLLQESCISARAITGTSPYPTLMAYEFEEPLAALISSSARHSAIDFTLRNADSRVYQNICVRTTSTPRIDDRRCLHRRSKARSLDSLSEGGTHRRLDDGPYPANRYVSSLLEDQC